MKMNKFFMLGLAGLAFAACSNEEDLTSGVSNDGTKSMYLKFEGLSSGVSGRAVEEGKTAGQIALTNFTVYFTDATGVIKKTETLNDDADDWATIGTAGHLFHSIPNSVEQVYVVGNADGKSLPVVTPNTTNISAVKNQALQIAGEQDFGDVILFGGDTQIAPVTEGDRITDDQGHTLLYKAEVALAPFVSRFEVKGIQCEDLTGSKYKKIVLEAIGLMDYNNRFTLGGTASEEMTIDNVLEPGSTAVKGKYIFGETTDSQNGTYTNYSWAWDKIIGAELAKNDDIHDPAAGYYVYQFSPAQIGSTSKKNVQIKLAVDAYTDETTKDPFGAVVTASFNKSDGQPLTAFEAGKIYRIDSYKFKVENVGPWNPDEEICVNVKVTVADWEIVTLTPVFE